MYFDPYFSSKFGEMYSPPPPLVLPFVAFRVNGPRWASKTQPSTPTRPPTPTHPHPTPPLPRIMYASRKM